MRLATIDVGTNTALLLVAEVASGTLTPIYEAERFVRLGEGVDASGSIRSTAMDRLCTVLRDYRSIAGEFGVECIVVAGTSASRDAANREELVDRVRRETGLGYEILSGSEEACWTFVGALAAFPGLTERCMVFDLGGGSTEFAGGLPGHPPAFRSSIDIGSVRLTERFFGELPPPRQDIEAAQAWAERLMASAVIPFADALLVGTAGTPACLAAVIGHSFASIATGTVALTPAEIRRWRDTLLAMPVDEIFALRPSVMQGRADVFPAAVLLLDTVLRCAGAEACLVSPYGLRHGLALRAVAS